MEQDATNSNAIDHTNLSDLHGRFKAIGTSALTSTAKYIATLMLATGVRSPIELRSISGLAKTTVYRVLSEIYESSIAEIFAAFPTSPDSPAIPSHGTTEIPTSPADGNCSEKTVPTVPTVPPVGISEPKPSCARDITTRANNELPSEVVILENNIPPLRTPTPKKSTGVRGTRLANDWELPEDWRQWTLVNCPCSTPDAVNREALIFANYWQALAGAKAAKVDWRKTWQNWCFKSFASGPIRERRDSGGLTAKQLQGRAVLAQIEARIAGYNS